MVAIDTATNLLRERMQADIYPLFPTRPPIPEDIDPERVIFVVRTFIDRAEREEEHAYSSGSGKG